MNKDIVYQFPNGDMIVRVQKDFPNCQKYNKCCTDDSKFWSKLNSKVKTNKPKPQPFRIKNVQHPNFDWCANARAYIETINTVDDEFAYEYAVIERRVRLP